MFISEKVVFMELQKTGCTHIRNILKDLLGGELVGKHNQATSDLFVKKRVFLGSIRDPWEWYISLWAFGCDNKGLVFGKVTKPGKSRFRGLGWKSNPYAASQAFLASLSRDSEKWKSTYRNVNDASAFREWLYMIHNKKYWYDFGEGFGVSSLSEFIGLLTYRYIKLFCCKQDELVNINALATLGELKGFEKNHCFINHFVRNENLELDLIKVLELSGFTISEEKESEILSAEKTNMSSRKNGSKYFYDRDTEKLVFERERLIVEKFGYLIPSSRD